MAKAKNTAVFFCQECGYESVKWMGQCPGCKTWNSFVEEKMSIRSKRNGVPVREWKNWTECWEAGSFLVP